MKGAAGRAARGARLLFVSALTAGLAGTFSCSKDASGSLPPPPSLKEAGGAVVARVGDVEVTEDAVRAIMTARGLDARAAAELAIRDALFARAAIDERLDVGVAKRLDAVLARDAAMTSTQKAEAAGPITDEELGAFVAKNYTEVARPEAWVTAAVIVVLGADAPEDDVARARAVAENARIAVLPVTTAMEGTRAPPVDGLVFRELQNAVAKVDGRSFTVGVQPLPLIGADGLTITPGSPDRPPVDDPALLKEAMALVERGDVSPVFRSASGFGVVVLLDRIPARFLPKDQLIDLFRDEIMANRAKAILTSQLEPLRAPIVAGLDRGLESALALVKIGGGEEPTAGAPLPTPNDPGSEQPR